MKYEEGCFYHNFYRGYEYVVFYWEREVMAFFNGYVKIPQSHPFCKPGSRQKWFSLGKKSPRHYHRDYDAVELDVHGGLTFGEKITTRNKEDFMQPFTPGLWVGWDYMHSGDAMYLPKERIKDKDSLTQMQWEGIMRIHQRTERILKKRGMADKRWTFEDVEKECKAAIRQLISKSTK